MVYLFLGEDTAAKNVSINEIKKEHFKSPESWHFDYEVFYGKKLDLPLLQKAFLALPITAEKRIIVLHEVHVLDKTVQEFLLRYILHPQPKIILILESEENSSAGNFLEQFISHAKVKYFQGKAKRNTFDMTKAIERRDSVEALSVLSELLSGGVHPLQIMGGLVWFWGKSRAQVSADRFKKGLVVLGQADLNIKRSRFNPEYALEMAVVRLTEIIEGSRSFS